ncbi:hypothetical protein WBG83_21480 [Paenibacillus sp. y28]
MEMNVFEYEHKPPFRFFLASFTEIMKQEADEHGKQRIRIKLRKAAKRSDCNASCGLLQLMGLPGL